MTENCKYNYVIVTDGNDFNIITFQSIKNNNNVKFYNCLTARLSRFANFLRLVHYSSRINKIIKLPFKRVWNRFYFNTKFETKRPICFVFIARVHYKIINLGLADSLKKRFPDCKLVIYFGDKVDPYIKEHKDFDIELIKDTFDVVFSYNKFDVEKYSLNYYLMISSMVGVELNVSNNQYDLLFVGRAKDRLNEILKAYEICTALDIKCCFYIVEVDESEQKYADNIIYNKFISYEELLKLVQCSKCILEVTQDDVYGFTLRICEALFYNKKLLTNNIIVKEIPYYNDKYISVFSDVSEIDTNFIKTNITPEYNYQDDCSPEIFLKTIEQILNNSPKTIKSDIY